MPHTVMFTVSANENKCANKKVISQHEPSITRIVGSV